MDLLKTLGIVFTRFSLIDLVIFAAGVLNLGVFYRRADMEADRLYRHFYKTDGLSALQKEALLRLQNNSKKDDPELSNQQLLFHRDSMNRNYSTFTIITSMFPLMGMLGTVASLIPMVSSIGAEDTHLFFGALTSTFWGIVFALICKILDTRINYKIEDNEKHLEYLLNPKR